MTRDSRRCAIPEIAKASVGMRNPAPEKSKTSDTDALLDVGLGLHAFWG